MNQAKLSPTMTEELTRIQKMYNLGHKYRATSLGSTHEALLKRGLIKYEDIVDGVLIYPVAKQEAPKTLAQCKVATRIVIDTNGKRYEVKRGREFLDLMIKLQKKNLV